jgi:hypothetical protein
MDRYGQSYRMEIETFLAGVAAGTPPPGRDLFTIVMPIILKTEIIKGKPDVAIVFNQRRCCD